MKKRLIMTSVNGVNKYACPKCDGEMKHVETGRIGFRGEVEDSIEEFLTCPNCGLRQDYPKMPACAFRSLGGIG